MSCTGLWGLLCHSGVLGSSGGCVGAAGSPWPPLGAPGLSCQVSPSFVTTFFSSKAAEVLRKEECHNGADVVGLVLGHSLHAHVTSRGHGGLLSGEGGRAERSPAWPLCPRKDPRTATPFPPAKAASARACDDFDAISKPPSSPSWEQWHSRPLPHCCAPFSKPARPSPSVLSKMSQAISSFSQAKELGQGHEARARGQALQGPAPWEGPPPSGCPGGLGGGDGEERGLSRSPDTQRGWRPYNSGKRP